MPTAASNPDLADEAGLDAQLIGVWSREHPAGVAARSSDVRMIYLADRSGRYETWSPSGLTEVITFTWHSEASGRVSMEGCEYVFRDEHGTIRHEPCDWHFPRTPFEITVAAVPAAVEMTLLKLHYPGDRVDTFGLVTRDVNGWEDFHF